MLARLFVWFFLVLVLPAGAYTVDSLPNPRATNGSHVVVEEGVFSAQEGSELDHLLKDIEQRTGAQIAVVAVERIEPPDVFTFSQQLFERWGIGRKGRDDGLLILLVKGQRTVRMHTGYGLEGVLPDALCKRIQDERMVPFFRQGQYAQGLLAGVREVDRLLSDPAYAAEQRSVPEAYDDSWYAFLSIVGGGGGLLALIVFAFKSMGGYFSASKADSDETPIAMRYARTTWLLAFLGLPALLLLAVHLRHPLAPVSTAAALLYGYFMLLAAHQAWREEKMTRLLWAERKYVSVNNLLDHEQGFWAWMAAIFPLPFLFFLFYHRWRKSHLRRKTRTCAKCGQPMRRLSETEEDAYLTAAEQKEEELRSLDYDVWLCASCESTVRWVFPGAATQFARCPKCHHQTLALLSNTVLQQATEAKAGQGELLYSCHFCQHEKHEKYRIARLVSSSSDSSSGSSSSGGSSSSSGSSWGGGSSGGGGASSSW